MVNSTRIDELIHKLMEIDVLGQAYTPNYSEIMDEIDFAEDVGAAFRNTVEINGHDVYVHIHEIEEDTRHIRAYAVGIQKEGNNVVRYDNRDHHDGLTHAPHHKHIGEDEKVFNYDGNVDTMIKELEEIHLPKIMKFL